MPIEKLRSGMKTGFAKNGRLPRNGICPIPNFPANMFVAFEKISGKRKIRIFSYDTCFYLELLSITLFMLVIIKESV